MTSDLVVSGDYVTSVYAQSNAEQAAALRVLDDVRGLVVTAETLACAKAYRARLGAALKEASGTRMAAQRKLKATAFGAFVFSLTEAEREIKAERERLDADIKRVENAPSVRLREDVQTFVCFVTGTQAQVNALAVEANERGLAFENRGPLAEGAAATEEPTV